MYIKSISILFNLNNNYIDINIKFYIQKLGIFASFPIYLLSFSNFCGRYKKMKHKIKNKIIIKLNVTFQLIN